MLKCMECGKTLSDVIYAFVAHKKHVPFCDLRILCSAKCMKNHRKFFDIQNSPRVFDIEVAKYSETPLKKILRDISRKFSEALARKEFQEHAYPRNSDRKT